MPRFIYQMVGFGRDVAGSFRDPAARGRVAARANAWVKPLKVASDDIHRWALKSGGQFKLLRTSIHREILGVTAIAKRGIKHCYYMPRKWLRFVYFQVATRGGRRQIARRLGLLRAIGGDGDVRKSAGIDGAMLRLRERGLAINSFISIGAGTGDDSHAIHEKLCPDAHLLMIEAQNTHIASLENLRQKYAREDYVICAAAADDGTVTFLASAPTGGAVSKNETEKSITVPARSIDSLVRERKLQAPYFLKFDTHGVELDILAGTSETLSQTALIMMECYNFRLNYVDGKNLTFYEMCSYLEDKGFRCIDISDPLFRPNDLVLWQMHLYFVRKDHPVFGSNSFSAPRTAPAALA